MQAGDAKCGLLGTRCGALPLRPWDAECYETDGKGGTPKSQQATHKMMSMPLVAKGEPCFVFRT